MNTRRRVTQRKWVKQSKYIQIKWQNETYMRDEPVIQAMEMQIQRLHEAASESRERKSNKEELKQKREMRERRKDKGRGLFCSPWQGKQEIQLGREQAAEGWANRRVGTGWKREANYKFRFKDLGGVRVSDVGREAIPREGLAVGQVICVQQPIRRARCLRWDVRFN